MGQDNSGKTSKRYDFVKATWGEKLFAWSRQDKIGQALGDDADSVFASVAKYDFTKDSKKPYQYLFWLCRFIVKDNIKPENIYKIKENLETFLRVRKGLPEDKQDISKIGSAQELDDLVDPYQDIEVKSLGQLAREEREAILSETVFHYDGEHGKILTPLTKRAAIFWGQGTKWCFSATKTKNFFDDYKHSPLVIYITNDIGYRTVVKKIKDEKSGQEKEQRVQAPYQIKFAGHKDSDVKDVKDKGIESIPESLRNLVLHADKIDFFLEHGSIKPTHFPPKTFSEKFLLDAIESGSINLASIHQEERTATIYLAAVTKKGSALGNVPKDLRTENLCFVAVTQSADAFGHVPKDKLSERINKAYIRHDFRNIKRVTLNDNLLRFAFNVMIRDPNTDENEKISQAIGYQIRPQREDEDWYDYRYNRTTTINFQSIMTDQQMDMLFVKPILTGLCEIEDISPRKRTPALLKAAMKRDHHNTPMYHVPRDKFNDALYEEIYLVAIERCYANIVCVPKEKRTERMYREVMKQDFQSFIYFNDELQSKPYYKDLKRIAFETMMYHKEIRDLGKKASELSVYNRKAHAETAQENIHFFEDVMTEEERKQIFGGEKPFHQVMRDIKGQRRSRQGSSRLKLAA